jgi:hypothetical protein
VILEKEYLKTHVKGMDEEKKRWYMNAMKTGTDEDYDNYTKFNFWILGGQFESKYPPAKPGALRLLAPQKGLIAIGKKQEKLKPMDDTRIALSPQARIHDRNPYSRKCQTLGVPRQSRGFT